MNSNNTNNNNKGTAKGNSKGNLNNDILNSSSEVTAMNNNTNETDNTTAKNINTNETDKTVGTKELPTSNNDVTDKDSIITETVKIENEPLSKTMHKKWGIIVKPENEDRIMEVINKAQRNATSRTIEDFNHITTILKEVERRIGSISKSSLEGTRVCYDHGQHFPNSYRWTPNSTHVSFTYHNGKWYFEGAVRTICPNRNSGYHYKLTLSESAKKAILARYE